MPRMPTRRRAFRPIRKSRPRFHRPGPATDGGPFAGRGGDGAEGRLDEPHSPQRSQGEHEMSGSEKGRRSALWILASAGALVVVLGAAMYIYDHSRRDVIADGVRIDGVSVGGLHASAARTKVQAELGTRLSRPVRVRHGSQVWTLNAREAHLAVNVENMV